MASNMESIQKRVMFIIFPTYDYNEALSALSLTTLNERRESTYVRSTLRDYTTKTTRYTLFSLNCRKFSIINIWSQRLATAYAQFVTPSKLTILAHSRFYYFQVLNVVSS